MRWLAGSIAMLAACGDPVADGSYEGEPRLEVDGLVCAIGNLDATTTALGVAWTPLGASGRVLDVIAGEARPIDVSLLPAEFQLVLFERPPAGTATAISDGRGATVNLAIGVPILFEDRDGDGVWQTDEPLLGASHGQVIVYGGASGAASEASIGLAGVPTGYGLAEARCRDDQLTGFVLAPSTARFEVWLFDGVLDNPLDGHAPVSCLNPF